jgi:elongation factor Ts
VEIKASDIKKLREQTGAGILDCKKALAEANGDYDRAVKILKELGLAAAAKRSARATDEGRIFSLVKESKAGIMELSCETDFVARNQDFIDFGASLLSEIVENEYPAINDTLKERVSEVIGRIKENINLKRFTTMSIEEKDVVVEYIHGEGAIGVLVKLTVDDSALTKNERVREFAFDCALHIAAFNPLFLSRKDVDEAYLKEQEEIFLKQAESLDKPEKVMQGIVKGKLNKHLSEICLLNQGFVKEDKTSVEKMLQQVGKEVGGTLTISEYVYYKVGEE